MKLVESLLTKNPCYTAGRTITVKGLMLHSVGCSQPSALAFIKNWNSPSFERACVHGFIDGNDKVVVPCIYDLAEDFKDGFARVTLKGKSFYITKQGKKVPANKIVSM